MNDNITTFVKTTDKLNTKLDECIATLKKFNEEEPKKQAEFDREFESIMSQMED